MKQEYKEKGDGKDSEIFYSPHQRQSCSPKKGDVRMGNEQPHKSGDNADHCREDETLLVYSCGFFIVLFTKRLGNEGHATDPEDKREAQYHKEGIAGNGDRGHGVRSQPAHKIEVYHEIKGEHEHGKDDGAGELEQ